MTSTTATADGDQYGSPHGRPRKRDLIIPFWISEEKYSAFIKLAIYFVIVFGSTWLSVKAIRLTGAVTDALVNRKWDDLYQALFAATVVGVLFGSSAILRKAIADLLDLQWRTWMTRKFLAKWTESHAFYDIEREGQLSNTDQRISEDIKLFVDQTLSMFMNLVTAIVQGVTFGVVLWKMAGTLRFELAGYQVAIPGYMVFLAFIYTGLELVIVHWVGKRMVGLNNEKQTVEADFRYGAMQLRENAEQVAFYSGGRRERGRLFDRFEKIRVNTVSIVYRTAKVMFTQSAYGHIFHPVPTLAALPRYFAGEITLGGMTQMTQAFGSFNNTLNLANQWYLGIAAWFAISNRLRDLSWALAKAESRPSGISVESNKTSGIQTTEITLRTPHKEALTTIAPQTFAPGERWLIRGPSGTGKSTFLRAAAGLWPYGEGSISLPAGKRMMFLPQRSYIPEGSLKAALAYPAQVDDIKDEDCLEALRIVGLEHRAKSLTEVERWQQKLSGGEQQRLALARVLIHKPEYVFLDEATSALDEEHERRIYEALVEKLANSTIVSVAHRSALVKYHDNILEMRPAHLAAVAA